MSVKCAASGKFLVVPSVLSLFRSATLKRNNSNKKKPKTYPSKKCFVKAGFIKCKRLNGVLGLLFAKTKPKP